MEYHRTGTSGFIQHLPRQLTASRRDVIATRPARGGDNIRLHQHITETLYGVRP
jgi:hypothetical protein